MQAPLMVIPETPSPFERLLYALEEGWRVQPPVYFRQMFHAEQSKSSGYYFILKRGAETDLIVVPADEQTRQLIELQRLKVLAA